MYVDQQVDEEAKEQAKELAEVLTAPAPTVPTRKLKMISGKKKDKGMGFTFCEGLVTEQIEQSYKALNIFNSTVSKKSPAQILLGVYGIVRHEALNVHEGFDGLQDSILSPKHRQVRDINEIFSKILTEINLKDIPDEELETNDQSILFIKVLIDYLSCAHKIMLDSTTTYIRKKFFNQFKEDWS